MGERTPLKHVFNSIVPCFVSVVEQEVESETGEVSDEDMHVARKQGDASEEEEIELVVDEDQRDMREFLQSEEGTKWLQDNPDKKARC